MLYRQVNHCFKDDYDSLIGTGLFHSLVNEGILIPHAEVNLELAATADAYKVLQPELIEYISYPYEWSFSQLKDAALLTLQLQKTALGYDMSLKDCSAYNIQFHQGKPVFIDTLSFERCREGEPWVAYRQFCQHFLAPLALMSRVDIRFSQLLRIYLDGIPLDLASSLLPVSSRCKLGLLLHLHLHARSQKYFAGKKMRPSRRPVNKKTLLGLADHLESTVRKLIWKLPKSTWIDYYKSSNYVSESFQHKAALVDEFLKEIHPRPGRVLDLGANTGFFSRISSAQGMSTLSLDMDAACVERNYQECIRHQETKILPLLMDLTNPSSGLGWKHEERASWMSRGTFDAVFALALIHHLAIANNIPFSMCAEFCSQLSRFLIVEFVPKADSQVQILLSTRKDIFPDYTQDEFERIFGQYFVIVRATKMEQTERVLYLMKRIRDE